MSSSPGTGRGGGPLDVEDDAGDAPPRVAEAAAAADREAAADPERSADREGAADGAAGADPERPARPRLDAAARKRVAVETFARHETSLRRAARRFSLCADDADEALQRGFEILLRKAPSEDRRELIRWTQTVIKHEALAVRAERERILAGPAAAPGESDREDWVALLPADSAGPAERAERHEAIERSREALATLKPQELRALGLLAEGYSYREIATITGFSATKVNRAIAEGRERFRRFLVHREGGARCAELAPLLSALADDEADAADVATLREHLRTCGHCRSTLRAYRAAPGAAAALLPLLPVGRGGVLLGRLHDAYAALATRLGGGAGASESTLGGIAAAGGTRGAGMTALAKALAVCAGTVGGAAACVAGGVVPAPLLDPPAHHSTPAAKVSHPHADQAEETASAPLVEYQPEPEVETEPTPVEKPDAKERQPQKESEEEPAAATETTPPPSESGAVEYVAPPPPPPPSSAGSSEAGSSGSGASGSGSSGSATSGSAAGEFGP